MTPIWGGHLWPLKEFMQTPKAWYDVEKELHKIFYLKLTAAKQLAYIFYTDFHQNLVLVVVTLGHRKRLILSYLLSWYSSGYLDLKEDYFPGLMNTYMVLPTVKKRLTLVISNYYSLVLDKTSSSFVYIKDCWTRKACKPISLTLVVAGYLKS